MKNAGEKLDRVFTGIAATCTIVFLYIAVRAIQTGNLVALFFAILVLFISCPLLVLLLIRHARQEKSLKWISDLLVRDEDDSPKMKVFPRWLVMSAIYILSALLILYFLAMAVRIITRLWGL